MVQAALDQAAASWRRRLAGPVLLADRGSDDAEVARCAAADVAAHAGVPLRLVTAWEVPAIGRVTPTAGELDVSGVYETSARAAQEVVRDHLVSLGMRVGAGYVAEGSAVALVAQTADAIDASLVVIGSRAGRGVGGHLMGLLPEAFVRGVHRPVLVVRGQSADWPPRSIIIVDAEGCDDPAVATEGAKLARVLKIPAALVRVTSQGNAPGFDWTGEPSLKSTREEVRRRASRLEAETGAEVTSWVTTGDPVGGSPRSRLRPTSSCRCGSRGEAPRPGQDRVRASAPGRRSSAHRAGAESWCLKKGSTHHEDPLHRGGGGGWRTVRARRELRRSA
jgi:nucleotide-binding universal stress UspA family protein